MGMVCRASPSLSESAAFGGMLSFASDSSSPASVKARGVLQWDDDDNDDDDDGKKDDKGSPSQKSSSPAKVEDHNDGKKKKEILESPSQSGQKLNLPFSPSEHSQKSSTPRGVTASSTNDIDSVRQHLSFTEKEDDEKGADADGVQTRRETDAGSESAFLLG